MTRQPFYQVTIDTLGFDNNGNERTEIEAAFFANCDKDKEQELLITYSTFIIAIIWQDKFIRLTLTTSRHMTT